MHHFDVHILLVLLFNQVVSRQRHLLSCNSHVVPRDFLRSWFAARLTFLLGLGPFLHENLLPLSKDLKFVLHLESLVSFFSPVECQLLYGIIEVLKFSSHHEVVLLVQRIELQFLGILGEVNLIKN